MKRNTSGTGSLFPRTFLAYEQEASATNARIGRSRKFQRFHPFFHEQRGDARPAIVTSCNPFSTFSLSLSLSLSPFLCRGKMQTIIQGTIGWTRLSLVIGNESSSGRGQSVEIARAPLLPVTLSQTPSKDSSNFYRDPGSERVSLLSTMDTGWFVICTDKRIVHVFIAISPAYFSSTRLEVRDTCRKSTWLPSNLSSSSSSPSSTTI